MTKAKKLAPGIASVRSEIADYRNQLFTTTEAINAETERLGTTQRSLDLSWHKLAVSVLAHLCQHRNINVVRNMLEKMSDGQRKNTMFAYLELYGQVRFEKQDVIVEGKTKQRTLAMFDKSKSLNLEGAIVNKWFQVQKEAEYKPFDLAAEVSRILEKASKKLTNSDESKGDFVSPEAVSEVRKLVIVLQGMKSATSETANADAQPATEQQAA